MIARYRQWYNKQWNNELYNSFLSHIYATYQHVTPFRIAETPFFIPSLLKERLLEACDQITDVICSADFKEKTQNAIPSPSLMVPREDAHTTFLQMDFGVTLDEKGDPMPRLIEIQGFPSVYFLQEMISKAYRSFFSIPGELHTFFDPAMTPESYIALLRDVIVGNEDPKQVVMLEIEPEKQTTYIDFLATADKLGVVVLCLTKIIKSGNKLYYKNETGELVHIRRIYNRVIFDELEQRSDLAIQFAFTDELDVKWVGHPNWFYRISKYTMPLLSGPYVPKSYYLHTLKSYPADLENYVLKPLFSFAGAGVELNVTPPMLDAIQNKDNFILQEKVSYAPVIDAPGEGVKCEIRMLMLWPDEELRPRIVNNLVRLSKGAMIGVKYNKDKDWVGGSVGFFEQ